MFRKLVSNLPYSPTLIADVGFYAKRLKQENATHRTTLIFVTLALIVQSVAVLSPPESANASSEQDLIRGGVSSLDDFLIRYDRNEEDIKDIYNTAGVTKSEIKGANESIIIVSENMYTLSRFGKLSSTQKEIGMSYQKSSGGTDTRYFSPLSSIASQGSRLKGWVGTSATLGWFAIVKSNGSLVTKDIPTSINPVSQIGSSATQNISIRNLTQKIDNNSFLSKADDRISYTIEQTNESSETVSAPFSVRLTDAMEYALLYDSGGGSFNTKTKVLSWPSIDLAPNESQVRSFIIQILPDIPATGVGLSNQASYDCSLSVAFGNIVKTPVDCPPVKSIEGLFALFPSAGAGINIGFSVVLVSVVIFFYIRTRQLKSEIRVIRHNFNTGVV